MFEEYLDKNGNLSSVKLRGMPVALRLQLLERWETKLLTEAIFCEKLGHKPICEQCGSPASFLRNRYSRWCGVSCATTATVARGPDASLSRPETRRRIKETMLTRHGVDNPQKIPAVKAKIKQTCIERYGAESFLGSEIGKEKANQGVIDKFGVSNISQAIDAELRMEKVRATMEQNGHWVPAAEVPAYVKYQRKILALTNQNVHLLPDYDPTKRGPSNKNGDNWQVDHRLSVCEGWRLGISPEHMAHPANLQFIPWRENLAKRSKSDLTKEELLALIEEQQRTNYCSTILI